MKAEKSSDEPTTMLDLTLNAILDEYTDYAISLIEQNLEPSEVLEKLTSFAQSRKPEILASLRADSDPIFIV